MVSLNDSNNCKIMCQFLVYPDSDKSIFAVQTALQVTTDASHRNPKLGVFVQLFCRTEEQVLDSKCTQDWEQTHLPDEDSSVAPELCSVCVHSVCIIPVTALNQSLCVAAV